MGYGLFIFGVADFVLAALSIVDLTYWLIGDLAYFTPFICGGIGWYLINRAETETQTKIDDLDIEEDESINFSLPMYFMSGEPGKRVSLQLNNND